MKERCARARAVVATCIAAVMAMSLADPVAADETDNYTCRSRLTVDSQPALDRLVNERIQLAVDRANAKGARCDAACMAREIRRLIGSSEPAPVTWIPHSRLALWVARRSGVERCRVSFSDSIYGARPYDQPWLFPVTRRVIFLADSILLSRSVVGLDKIDHFIREGQAHYDAFERGRILSDILRDELGRAARPLAMTEYGLKGRALTGVVSYADLAAGYAGFLFWRDLLAVDRPQSFVAYDDATRRFVVRRQFTFAGYVSDAWDEAINRSGFHPALGREVEQALRARDVAPFDCHRLADLPDARLYVNPECLGDVKTTKASA